LSAARTILFVTHPARSVSVLVDDSGRVGPLSYLVPDGLTLVPGTAVHVPFGRRECHGLVLGEGDTTKATREVIRAYGVRATPIDISVAATLADRHFSTLVEVAARLSPSSGRGSTSVDPGELRLVDIPVSLPQGGPRARLLLASPLEDQTLLAAAEAARLCATHPNGQVLVLCPTRSLVEATLSRFASGAVRLDAQAPAGAWASFVSGAAAVGVGSRAASLYSAARLVGVVVIESDHPGHREASQPYWDSIEVAKARAEAHGCAVTVVSAAPALRHLKGLKVVTSTERLIPHIRVVNLDGMAPAERLAPAQLLAAASSGRRRGHEVIAVTTGRSERICTGCRSQRPCACGAASCEHRETVPCDLCGAVGVRWSGLSSAQAAKRHDADRAVTLEEAAQMSTAARVVLVPSADRFLTSSSMDGDAHAYRNLVRLARAAGPGGELVLCTFDPAHPVIRALRGVDPRDVLTRAWKTARSLNLPPHHALLTVRVAQDKEPKFSGVPGTVFGPSRRGREWELVVSFPHEEHGTMAAFVKRLRRRGKVRVALQ
jgi:primosomal protein N'